MLESKKRLSQFWLVIKPYVGGPEFDPWDLHGRRELTTTNSLLTFLHMCRFWIMPRDLDCQLWFVPSKGFLIGLNVSQPISKQLASAWLVTLGVLDLGCCAAINSCINHHAMVINNWTSYISHWEVQKDSVVELFLDHSNRSQIKQLGTVCCHVNSMYLPVTVNEPFHAYCSPFQSAFMSSACLCL